MTSANSIAPTRRSGSDKAVVVYQQAIDAGNVSWGSLGLARIYAAQGTLNDPKKAVRAYRSAIDAGKRRPGGLRAR